MISFREMTSAELRHTLRVMATSFARAAFQRLNPSTSDEVAWAWAARSWHRFEARAVDCLALMEACRERIEAN